MKKTNIFSPTLDTKFVNLELWAKIEQLDLTLISDRMLIKHEWTEERTANAIKGYRQYLYLTQVFGKPISPTGDVDEIWHEHVLHTNKYSIDCQKLFNKFLHHFPTPSKWKQEQQLKQSAMVGSFCCDNADCCNDDPRTDTKPNEIGMTAVKGKKISITADGSLVHSDCGEPAPGGCAPIGGSDDYCSGTTSDGFTNKAYNFDNPDMSAVPTAVLFKDVFSTVFQN